MELARGFVGQPNRPPPPLLDLGKHRGDTWLHLLISQGSKHLLNMKKVFCWITTLAGLTTWLHKCEAVHRRRRESVSGDDEEGWERFCSQQPAGMLNQA